MKKKNHSSSGPRQAGRFEHLPTDSDFYAGGGSGEQPLYQERAHSASSRVRKTGRHKAVTGRRKEAVDQRERMALLAILKTAVMILLLGILFFMLWKGIKLYEESIWMKNQVAVEPSPVMREVALVEDFNITNANDRLQFVERVEIWKETDRLVRSADNLLKGNNFDQAILRCQEALRLDPAHMGALERLGTLYFSQGLYVESINSYIRLLSVDPSRADLQKLLIQSLDAHGDSDAVVFMAQWYLSEQYYDADIQRFLANAYYKKEQYAEAAAAYERVVKDSPKDNAAQELLAKAYMKLGNFEQALVPLETLRESNYREANYYRMITVCNAQLGRSQETVQTLGRAAHLFGQNTVIGWMQDPLLDPVRQDRTFQAFADRVGGEEFRKWLEKVAQTMEGSDRKEITPLLTLPEQDKMDTELLKPRK